MTRSTLAATAAILLAAIACTPAVAQTAAEPVPAQWTLDEATASNLTPLPASTFSTPLMAEDARPLTPLPTLRSRNAMFADTTAQDIAIPVLGRGTGAVALGVREHVALQRLTHLGGLRRGEATVHPDAERIHDGRLHRRATTAGAGLRLAF